MNLKCLIIDDEPLARQLVQSYAEKLPFLEVVSVCKSPLEALNYLQHNKIDLLFLDIQMPELSGIDFLESLTHSPAVILTTAYSDYALKGYELDVVDYLLKPFGFDRFLKAVNKVQNKLSKESPTTNSTAIQSTQPNTLHIKSEGKTIRINPTDILYIEGLKEYVSYYTKDERIISLASIKHLMDTLPQDFIRIHKSYIVNSQYVKALNGNTLELLNGHVLPIGKTFKERVTKVLF